MLNNKIIFIIEAKINAPIKTSSTYDTMRTGLSVLFLLEIDKGSKIAHSTITAPRQIRYKTIPKAAKIATNTSPAVPLSVASLSAFQLKANKEGTVKAAVAKKKIEITIVEVILGLSYVFSILISDIK